ncbi:MAG: flagellar biosynthesis protein FlhB [Synergistaceae bacterium]|nr:flagellar biosynthesis protein FlhB [Synergistaceae bacterium]
MAMTFDLQFFSQERTEPATPKKRRKEREEGRVAKSQDLGAAVVILTGLFALMVFGRYMFTFVLSFTREIIGFMGEKTLLQDGWFALLEAEAVPASILPWLPLGIAASLGALLVTVSQVGFTLTAKPLTPKMDRFNPVSGLKKVISLRSLVEMAKGLMKAALFALVIYFSLRKDTPEMVQAIRFPLEHSVPILLKKLMNLSFRLAFLLLVIAVFDYIYQKWEFERSIKMSKQEMKEEYKQMEGDPQVRSKIRQKQREMARSRMMSSVPKADVVITNPTRLAVALEYDRDIMEAPVVSALGSGYLAGRIREIAAENGIPLVENKTLARALFETLEPGDAVPEVLYKAVAEVLAFVYKMKEAPKKPTLPPRGNAPEEGDIRRNPVFM